MQVRDVTDVLVIGGGGAGLAAAIEAASHGCRVVLLEKNDRLGGTTGLSIGSISAAGTPDQKRVGIIDSVQAHFEDMEKFPSWRPGRDNLDLRRMLTENSAEAVAWLRSFGIEFLGPFPEPPHRVPRMHNVLPNSNAYIDRLGRAARRLGVDIRLGATVRDLIMSEGRAVGANVEQGRTTGSIGARRAVILAGGDFANNPAMKSRFSSAAVAEIPGVNLTATGDCQQMVEAVGGEIINGDLVIGPRLRFVPPPTRGLEQMIPPLPALTRLLKWVIETLPQRLIRPFVLRFMTTVLGPEAALYRDGAMLVNKFGERCPVEQSSPGDAVGRAPDQMAFIVFDCAIADKYSAWPHFVSTAPGVAYAYMEDYRRTRPDLYKTGATLDELATAIGVPSDALSAAVESHNAISATKLLSPPYQALGPIRAFVTMTEGGAKVSANLQVLRRDGMPIPGLFAAGSAGQGGLQLEGHGHHLGWAFVSGRIAGRNAARQPPLGE